MTPEEHKMADNLTAALLGEPAPNHAFRAQAAKVAARSAAMPAPVPAKALTYDSGKAPLAHLPWAAIEGLAMVQAYGHQKYKDFNNYRKGMEVSRNLSCALRHIKEYMEGIDTDAESGRNPLEHALCRIAFVLQNIHDGTATDDRYKGGK